jgi:hypothetical protein
MDSGFFSTASVLATALSVRQLLHDLVEIEAARLCRGWNSA